MNEGIKKAIDIIVWWIPFRKLRDSVRTLLEYHYGYIEHISHLSSVSANFITLALDKLDIEDLHFPLPTIPDEYKRMTIIKYAQKYNCKIGIETGTYYGDTTYFCKDYFDKFYTIELSPLFFNKALDRFKNYDNIITLQGDSATVLPELLEEINDKAIFWLDGHYCGDNITAIGKKETPIMEELACIFNHKIKDHIILIDDARCFGTWKDYPSIKELEEYVKSFDKDIEFCIKNDIIRIVTKQNLVIFEYANKKAA